jgi:hypothetical protein
VAGVFAKIARAQGVAAEISAGPQRVNIGNIRNKLRQPCAQFGSIIIVHCGLVMSKWDLNVMMSIITRSCHIVFVRKCDQIHELLYPCRT